MSDVGEIFVEAGPGLVMLTTHAEVDNGDETGKHYVLEYGLDPSFARALAALLIQEADIADPKNDWVIKD